LKQPFCIPNANADVDVVVTDENSVQKQDACKEPYQVKMAIESESGKLGEQEKKR
jgi:hypothetical protein